MFLHSYNKTMKGETLVNDGVKPIPGSDLSLFGMCWPKICPYPSWQVLCSTCVLVATGSMTQALSLSRLLRYYGSPTVQSWNASNRCCLLGLPARSAERRHQESGRHSSRVRLFPHRQTPANDFQLATAAWNLSDQLSKCLRRKVGVGNLLAPMLTV